MAGIGTILNIVIERRVEGIFSPLDRDFQPNQLEKKLKDAMKLHRTTFIEGNYFPNKFIIHLNPQDYEDCSPLVRQTIEDLVICAGEYIRESGNRIIGDEGKTMKTIEERIVIDLIPDNQLAKGEVRIDPSFFRV